MTGDEEFEEFEDDEEEKTDDDEIGDAEETIRCPGCEHRVKVEKKETGIFCPFCNTELEKINDAFLVKVISGGGLSENTRL